MASSRKAVGSCTSNNGVGTVAWLNAEDPLFTTPLVGTEVSTNDDVEAGVSMAAGVTSEWLLCTMVGNVFAIPTGATINGFKVFYRRNDVDSGLGAAVASTAIKFVKAGSVVGNDVGSAGAWTESTEEEIEEGGVGELGGQTWTVAQVNATDFGVAISVTLAAGMAGAPPTFGQVIDLVEIEVFYTVPSGFTNVPIMGAG